MADYKRMVSYMYQYENGVKRKNVGYARVEAKNGQCKITLHMQLLGQLDSIFPTYLIQRDEDNMELIYLGDTLLKNQVMDSKLFANEVNIMDSGHKLSEMGGMLLFLNDNIFFATEWDDKPIIAKEVLGALKPKKQKETTEKAEAAQEALPSVNYYVKDEVMEQATASEAMGVSVEMGIEDLQVSNDWSSFQDGSNPEVLRDAEIYNKDVADVQELVSSQEEINSSVNSDQVNITEPVDEMNDYYAAQKLSLQEELLIPKYKLPRGWKTIERLQRSPINEVSMAEENVLEAAVVESPEARQSYMENFEEEQHLEIQQNLFGELLDQLQENREFQEQFPEYEDEVNEDNNNSEDRYEDETIFDEYNADEDIMEEYLEDGNLYEDEPETTDPSTDIQDELPLDTPEENLEENYEEPMEGPGDMPEPGDKDIFNKKPEKDGMQQPVTDDMNEQPDHPTAKNFFDNYPRIYPFEDNEIIVSVKIEPKDMGMLPKEVWPLSNNSFLMHGFYCYHHLIFAKLKNRNGTQYILGIPGIFHNRERFMAKMFGFENFKSIRKRDLRQGDFGYWYLPITF